ncbi:MULTISPECIES: PRC-barrel domain containing protein [unclassified Streptomyces]|uniref:PRC-barrel domain containing protein n=1 Tax=unclassified Streptomyces TaxID=2593676 RepID=UPI0035E1DCE3
MAENVWSYGQAFGHLVGTDLSGWRVEATDGHIGKVDKHSDEVGDAYLVVDTGVWIFGKEVLLPASTVTRIDLEEHTVHLGLTKEQIKNAPEFHSDKHLADQQYREEIAVHYRTGGPFGGGPLGGGPTPV